MIEFPFVTIEVDRGKATLAERSAGVEVNIIDYDDAGLSEYTPARLEEPGAYWELDYRRGEMTAFVPRELAATVDEAINLVQCEHSAVIVLAHAHYTHADLWGEVEI